MTNLESKPTVVVIEEDAPTRRRLRDSLKRDGYDVVIATTGETGLAAAIDTQPGAIILSLDLPDIDGMAVLQRLREWSSAAILVISARRSSAEAVSALDAGANDYLSKPFNPDELQARLRVALRSCRASERPVVFNSGSLQVDLARRSVTRLGQPLKLAPIEYSLLRCLVQYAGRVLTHTQLLGEVWNLHSSRKAARLRVYMAGLRRKIEIDPSAPELLKTIQGVGYCLELKP